MSNIAATVAWKAKNAARRQSLASKILPLYADRNGCKAIAVRLNLAPRIVRTVLIEQGVYQPGNIKRLNGGPFSRHDSPEKGELSRIRIVRRHVRSMRSRVRHCIDKKSPRPVSPTAGMTKAQRFKWHYHNDPQFKIIHLYRKRIRMMVKRGDRSVRTMELLGCSRDHLMAHLQSLFTEGMHLNNIGIGKGKWNIDHIVACTRFDLTSEAQQRVCFHWSNLQPLWSLENIAKGNRTDYPVRVLHRGSARTEVPRRVQILVSVKT